MGLKDKVDPKIRDWFWMNRPFLFDFRNKPPKPFSYMKPKSIYQHFIQGVHGKVQLKNDELHIDIYGLQHRDIIAPLFGRLQQKLNAQHIDPRCPWLNDHALSFSFK